MALSVSGYLPLTVKAMQTVYDSSVSALNGADMTLEKVEEQLQELKDKLEVMAATMLKYFDVEGSTVEAREESLRKKILALQQDTHKLTGSGYQEAFGRYIRAAEPYVEGQKGIQEKYEATLRAIAREVGVLTDDLKEIAQSETVSKKLYELLEPQIRQDLTTKHKGEKGYTYEKGYHRYKLEPYFAELTELMRSRLRRAYSNKRGQLYKLVKANIQSQKATIEITESNLWDIVVLSPGDAKNVFATHPGMRDSFLQEVRRIIIEKVKPEEGSIAEAKLGEAIDKIIDSASEQEKTDYAVNAITGASAHGGWLGFLGEVQALYYSLMLVKKGVNVHWAGGKQVNGAQPHSDVLLETAEAVFGIQVKNVTRPAMEKEALEQFNIDFQSFAMAKKGLNKAGNGVWESFFTDEAVTAAASLGIDPEVLKAVYQLMAMRAFNIPYIWDSTAPDGEKAVAVPLDSIDESTPGGGTYVGLRKHLIGEEPIAEGLTLDQFIGRIMLQYVAGLMFLQTGLNETTLTNPKANALFIIEGGKRVMTAYTIISKMLEDLKNSLARLNFHVTYKKEGDIKTNTIVNVFNNPSDTGLRGQFALVTSFDFSGLI